MAEKDITEKTLEALNDVFADIVNVLLFHGEQVVREEMLTDAPSYASYREGKNSHALYRDVSKYWVGESDTGIHVRISLLAFENQTRYDKDMVLRVLGYDGAEYRAELSGKERYPVVTLILYFGDHPWGPNKTLFDTVTVPAELKQYVNDYRLNLFEIAFLPEECIKRFKSDFGIVADYFTHSRNNPDYRPKDPVKFRHVEEMLTLMSVLTGDSRYTELMYDEEGGLAETMDKVLDRAEARGIAIGEARGRAEGAIQTLTRLVQKGLLSLTTAAQEAGLSPAEFEEKAEALGEGKK